MTEAQQSFYQLLLLSGRTEEAEEFRMKCIGQNTSEDIGGNEHEHKGN